MLYVVLTSDKPNSGELRDATRQAHLDFIETHRSKIKIGGPTVGAADKTNGGMMVVEADTLEEAEAIAAADPFAEAELFESTIVRPWKWLTGKPGA